jgi:tetratricopeptide (TPR) repeat protein
MEREAKMTTYVPRVSEKVSALFVGRAEALDAFYLRFAYRHMKNGIYYYGGGGLGKTWLLQKIILDSQDDPIRVATNIIDFFDTQNHSIRGLQVIIKSRLQAPEAFQPYDEAIERLEDARSKGEAIHPSAIASLESRANRLFIQCCQQAIIGREVILLFDTFERVQQRHVGQWLLQEFLPQVGDLIVVVAGRPEPTPVRMPDNVASCELKGLKLEELKEYIGHRLPEDVIESVWRRTSGAPLIVDLILDLPEPQRGQFIAEMSRLEDEKRIQDSPELQRWLVRQFSRVDDKTNWVIWAMAYLRRRFDVQMLKYVVENLKGWFGPGDYEEIFEELGQFMYVKEYPNRQSHLLHDEVQRMVAKYVLEEVVDPWEEMRGPLCNLIINHYYPETIEACLDPDLVHQLQAEQLGYILDNNPQAGLERYKAYQREIETTHDYDFEELLWGEVREHLDRFGDEAYHICSGRGQWLRRHSLFQEAEGHYRQMVGRFEQQQIETRQALGFMLMRQGRISEAETVFEESRTLVQEGDFSSLAMIENNLGQASRAAGQWDQAMKHYAASFHAATLARDSAGLVNAYINRGYLYSLQGLYSAAKQQCERALELLGSLPEPDSRGNIQRAIYARMNLGTAYRHSSDHAIAAQHYKNSLELAKKNRNREATCDALQHIGINEHMWGRRLRREQRELATACQHQLWAWQHLTQALEIARESDWRNAIADGLNRLAKVYREIYRLQSMPPQLVDTPDVSDALQEAQQEAMTFEMPFEIEYEHDLLMTGRFTRLNWLEKASRLFEVSALVADEANNFHRALESLTEVARTLEELGMEDEVPIVIRRIERIKGYDYQETLFAAMSKMILGDLDFKRQEFRSALERYKKAYADLAEQSGYALYLLTDRLRDLEWRVRALPSETTLEWCDTLEAEWRARALLSTRPEMLDLLERIRLEALQRQMEHKDND